MTEKDLKDTLAYEFRQALPAAVVFRHEDKNTAGIPDMSVTWKGLTIWLEIKFANPYIKSRGLQDYTCAKLAASGLAWHVIYYQKQNERKTLIVEPKAVLQGRVFEDTPDECVAAGFDHQFVIMFIRRICGDYE